MTALSDPARVNYGGGRRHKLADRKNDLYETPPEATRALIRHEATLPRRIWEPACGPGAIVRELRAAGRDVVSSDLVSYGTPDQDYTADFLMEFRAPEGVGGIVTNPPFKLSDAFVRKGLELCPVVIILNRLAFLEGAGRSDIIDRHLERVWVGVERLPMIHRDGWEGPKASSAMPFAWFVFRRDRLGASTTLRRISWRDPGAIHV